MSNSEPSPPLQDSVLLTPASTGRAAPGVIITISDRIVPHSDLYLHLNICSKRRASSPWRVRPCRSGSREPSHGASRPSASIPRAISKRCPSPGAVGPESRLRRRYADAPAACPLNRSRGRRMVSAAQAPTLRSSTIRLFSSRHSEQWMLSQLFEITAPPLTRKFSPRPGDASKTYSLRSRCSETK